MSTQIAEITVDPAGVAVVRPLARRCLCVCFAYHPGVDACTDHVNDDMLRCDACTAADVAPENTELDWLDYEEVAAGPKAVTA